MHKLLIAIPLYLLVTTILWCTKPAITYDHTQKQFRPFGTGKRATLLPMWLLSMLVAVLAYLASSVAPSVAPSWSGFDRLGTRAPEVVVSDTVAPDTMVQTMPEERRFPMDVDTTAMDLLNTLHTSSLNTSTPSTEPQQLPAPSSAPNDFPRRRTMVGGGGRARTGGRQKSPDAPDAHRVNTHGTRHLDARLRRMALRESRVWKRVMQ